MKALDLMTAASKAEAIAGELRYQARLDPVKLDPLNLYDIDHHLAEAHRSLSRALGFAEGVA